MTLLLAVQCRADDIYQRGTNGEMPLRPLKADVTILNADGDKLSFRTKGGSELSIALNEIAYVTVPYDAVLSAADQAYAARNYEAALDGYSKTLDGADASWKARYVALRSLDAAEKGDRFDVAIRAWIALARAGQTAGAKRPKLPARGSKLLDDAANELISALRGATAAPQRVALLNLLLDVQLTRGDAAAIDDVAAQVAASGYVSGSDPALDARLAEVRLVQARAAMQSKKYDVVIRSIDSAAPLLAEPGQQAEALFLVAEARAALADAAGDAAARRDAAIAYLRVVAHLSAEPSAKGYVTRSMLAAARLDALVGDVAAARALYDQLRNEYPDAPAAAQAATLSAKLPSDP